MSPCLSTAMVMFSGLVCVGKFVAFGSSTGTCWMMTRMVMMKMIRSTNITSTRGVTLMSDIASASSPAKLIAMGVYLASGRRRRFGDGCWPLVHAQAHLGARDQVGVQLMGKVADHFLHTLIATQQNVVTQHRGHRDGKADGGHDQRFADGSCDLVDGRLAGYADGDQGVIDADDGAQQSDEGRGGADGREHRQARLHAADDGVCGALQRLGDPLAGADGARQARLVGLVI